MEIIKTSGYSILHKAATKAVKEWKFVPAKKWGRTVFSLAGILINFQLKQDRRLLFSEEIIAGLIIAFFL
ncbi:MAG: energy transducer TonB [Planctomycetota bacterium]